MSDNAAESVGAPPTDTRSRAVSFQGVISLGNILILVGMIGTGAVGIFTVGGSVQRLQDQVQHEAELRELGEHSLGDRLVSMQQKEAGDVQNINQNLSVVREDMGGIRNDLHTLMTASTPTARR